MPNPTLRHVYGTLAELNDTLVTGGGAAMTNAANNARKLQMLDEVSRLIDSRAHRGSGFGPWVGTRKYDGDGRSELYLRADLADLDGLSIASSQGATPVEPVVDTDFILTGLDGYDVPIRKIVLHGQGSPATFGSAIRGIEVEGTWSYPYRTVLLGVTTGEALDTSETEIDVSGLTGLSPGTTILIDSEQMYVTATTDSTTDSITVERAVNGTAAASHLTTAAITRYVYHPSVHTCALRLAERRWTSAAGGGDGADGGGEVGILRPRESEDTIIRRMLVGIRLVGDV